MYKTLLQGGHFNRTTNTVEPAPSWDRRSFAIQFVDTVDGDVMKGMCVNGDRNGTFVIIALLEALLSAEQSEETKEAKTRVEGCFPAGVLKQIENGDSKGKSLLLEKIAMLTPPVG